VFVVADRDARDFAPRAATYRRLHELGARVVDGSAEFGMDGNQVLASVTSVAALACGIAGRTGSIRPGADADLLVVGGNPARDVAALRSVRAVFRAGRRIAL
jgi:imidazolonepropionase-like amidohydrolase